MGGFLVWRREMAIPNSVIQVFNKRGFQKVNVIELGAYRLAFAEKQLLRYPCFRQDVGLSLLLMGSVMIPNKSPQECLDALVSRHQLNGMIDTSDLFGNFLIISFEKERIRFYTDAANGYSLYFHQSGIWSDSQLAIVHALNALGEPTSWDHTQIVTNLSFGFLYGEHTIFKGVYRFDSDLHSSANEWQYMRDIRTSKVLHKPPRNKDEAIELQKTTLRQWFEGLRVSMRSKGYVCGLTGGLDSRLLALCLSQFAGGSEVKTYTNTHSKNSEQVLIAEQIANVLNMPFEMRLFQRNGLDIESNLYFNDGILRIYQIWLESAKGIESTRQLFDSNVVLLTGVGGEQYRNSYFASSHSMNFLRWFRTEFIRKTSGKPFMSKSAETLILQEFLTYVNHKLGRPPDEDWKRIDIERFLQLIFNPSVRLVRNHVENQVGITLSPFTEPNVMKAAELAEPYSRKHLSFEVELIRSISRASDGIALDYGFKPSGKIPMQVRGRMAINRWVPNFVLDLLYGWVSARRVKNRDELLNLPNSLEAIDAVRRMNLPLHLDVLMKSELMAPLVFELGFLILALDGVVLQNDSAG